jgi:hypothetical protein
MRLSNAEHSQTIHAESVSVSQLLSNFKRICVPHYQRSYAWTTGEVVELWDDLQTVINESEETYFLGSMVFVGPKLEEVEVVDGQQRLTWVSLLFCVLRDGCLLRNDQERATLLNERYISTRDFQTLDNTSRLSLNESDNTLYQEIVDGALTLDEIKSKVRSRSIPQSNRLLANSYVELYNSVSNVSDDFRDTTMLGAIQRAIADKIAIIQIGSPSDVSAYVLFETLNDRGLDLSLSDLLKNYLFSRSKSRLSEVRSAWMEISSTVGSGTLTQFLRHEWMSRNGKIRERELYGHLKRSINTVQDTLNYVKGLQQAAEVYAAIRNPTSQLWQNRGERIPTHLKEINIFGITQCYPLILSCQATRTTAEFATIARWIVNLSLRYSIIGEKGPGNLKTLYAKASVLARQSPFRLSDVKSTFKELWPDDEEFRLAFSTKTMTKEPLVKYILSSVDKRRSGSDEVTPDDAVLTIEHVLPKKPDRWPDRLRFGLHKEYLHRWGNLTLLTSPMNEECSNAPFDEKRDVYCLSRLEISKELANYEKWDEKAIERRQMDLAEVAVEVWTL